MFTNLEDIEDKLSYESLYLAGKTICKDEQISCKILKKQLLNGGQTLQKVKPKKNVNKIKYYTSQFQPPKSLKHNKHDLMKFWLLTYWSLKKNIDSLVD